MRTRWLLTLLLLAGLAGCGVESAGTFPRPGVQGTAGLVPAQRLQGVVNLQGAVVSGAAIRVYDLATGLEAPLISAGGQPLISAGGQPLISAGGQPLISAGGQNFVLTDSQGRFDILIPQSYIADALRVTARTDSATLVTLVTGQGQGLGEPTGAVYRLQQAAMPGVPPAVELSPASTVVAKAFSGALRLQLSLPPAERKTAIAGVLRTANVAYARVKAALAENPEPARAVVASLDEQGEMRDLAEFQRAVERLGVAEELGAQVNEIVAETPVVTIAPAESEARGNVKQPVREEFPVGAVEVRADGTVSVPNRERPRAAEGAGTSSNGVGEATLSRTSNTGSGNSSRDDSENSSSATPQSSNNAARGNPNRATPVNSDVDDSGNSTKAEPGNSSVDDSGNSSKAEPGNSNRTTPGNSGVDDSGNSSKAEPGNSNRTTPGNSDVDDSGNSSKAEPGNSSKAEPGNLNSTSPGHSSSPSSENSNKDVPKDPGKTTDESKGKQPDERGR